VRYLVAALLATFLALGAPRFVSVAQTQQNVPSTDQITRLKQQLGLTDQQSNQLRVLAVADQQRGADLQRKMVAAHRELNAAVLGGADKDVVRAKTEQLKRLTGQMIDLHTETMEKLAKILSPAQRKKLAGTP
jgi:Spy/CpxP family protein refolding chaperone